MSKTLAGKLRNIYSSGNEMTVLTLLDKLIKEVEKYEAEQGQIFYHHNIRIETQNAYIYLSCYSKDETSWTDNLNEIKSHVDMQHPSQATGYIVIEGDTSIWYPIIAIQFSNSDSGVNIRYVTPEGVMSNINETIETCIDTVTQED